MKKILCDLLVLLLVATASFAFTGRGGIVLEDGEMSLRHIDQLVLMGRDGCGTATHWLGVNTAASCVATEAAAQYTVLEPFMVTRMTVSCDDHSCIATQLLYKNGSPSGLACQTNGETASTPGTGTCTAAGAVAFAKNDLLVIYRAEVETCTSDELTIELELLRTSF